MTSPFIIRRWDNALPLQSKCMLFAVLLHSALQWRCNGFAVALQKLCDVFAVAVGKPGNSLSAPKYESKMPYNFLSLIFCQLLYLFPFLLEPVFSSFFA